MFFSQTILFSANLSALTERYMGGVVAHGPSRFVTGHSGASGKTTALLSGSGSVFGAKSGPMYQGKKQLPKIENREAEASS